MNPLVEKVYYRSPVFLQNVAVSILGFKLKNERFNKAGSTQLKLLNQSYNFRKEEIEKLQNKLFVAIARHAIETTIFYKEWAQENGISANDINSLDDISIFPVIEKNILRDKPELFKSNAPDLLGKQFSLSTSGTTGTPLTVYTDRDSRSAHYAFFSRLRSSYGVLENDRRATLFGRIILTADQKVAPFWRYDFAQKNLLMSSYHLGEKNLPAYYEKLKSYKPKEIFAYPSSIYAIANYIVKNGLDPLPLKLVMTTAENLLPHQRNIISAAFQAPIVNQYGCTEMAFFCSDFPDGTMKFHPEHGVIEVRDQNGDTRWAGNGELIATGFINYSMPVIRYAVGDRITLPGRDPYGKQLLADVAGRTDDVIYTLDGTPIGRLDPIFKGGAGIQCAQIYQAEDGAVDLRLVPDGSYSEQHGEALKAELIKRLGTEMKISISIFKEIQKEKNGKFRPVISHFKSRTT